MTNNPTTTFDAIAPRAGFTVNPKARALVVQHDDQIRAIHANRDLNEPARVRQISAARAATAASLDALRAEDRTAATRALDQQEGELRAALRPRVPSLPDYASEGEKLSAATVNALHRAERRALLADLHEEVEHAPLDAILDRAGDVAVYGDPLATTRAYRTAVRRLTALHAETPEANRGAVSSALISAQDTLRKHLDAHPGPTRALRQIDNRRASLAATVDAFYSDTLTRLLGLSAAADALDRQQRADDARDRVEALAGTRR